MIFFFSLFLTLFMLGTITNVRYRDTSQEALCALMLFLFVWSGMELLFWCASSLWAFSGL